MRLEGYDVKENPKLTFRDVTEKDKDIEGNPLPNGYIVFVRLEDCKVSESDGKLFYDAYTAPAIPVLYLDTYYGMGEFKTRRTIKGTNIDGQLVYEYDQAPMYFAYNGKVYVGSLKTLINYQ